MATPTPTSNHPARAARAAARLTGCLAATICLLVLSGSATAQAAGSDYEGTIVARHSDDFADRQSSISYLLERPGREPLRLRGSTSELAPGVEARLDGVRAGNTVEVESVQSVESVAPGTNSAPVEAPSGSAIDIAVLLVNFANDTSQPWTADQIKQTVFTGSGSVNAYFQESSTDSVYLSGIENPDGDVFGWYTIPYDNTSCNYTTFAAAARSQAAAAGKNLSGYDSVVYLWPDVPSCDWSGLAYLPGDEAFINGAPTLRVISHELSHNFGIHHASTLRCTSNGQRVFIGSSCSTSEYGDPFSVMGASSTNHPHAWHKAQLGFIPSANIQTVTASGTYALSPSEQSLPGETQLLRIQHGKNSYGQTEYYYIDLRQPFGSFFDNFSPLDPVVNGVGVRLAPSTWSLVQSKLLDGNPETSTFGDAAIGVGDSATDPATGVTIAPTAVDSNGATVNVTISPVPSSEPPAFSSPGDNPASPVSAEPPQISFSSRNRRVGRTRKLVVSAACERDCSLSANGTVRTGKRRARLAPARAGAPAGTPVRLELRFGRSALSLVRRAQRRGRKAFVSLKLIAEDQDGQTSTVKRRLRVRP